MSVFVFAIYVRLWLKHFAYSSQISLSLYHSHSLPFALWPLVSSSARLQSIVYLLPMYCLWFTNIFICSRFPHFKIALSIFQQTNWFQTIRIHSMYARYNNIHFGFIISICFDCFFSLNVDFRQPIKQIILLFIFN